VADQASNKRRVKDPETFRERAAKAAETPEPTRTARLKGSSSGRVRSITRPIGHPLRVVTGTKPARLIGKVLLPSYLRNSWRELKLVAWPNWLESRRLTYAVLIFAVIFGAAIALVDYGLDKLFKDILLK
jgi:preprotein translocase SecE subunit